MKIRAVRANNRRKAFELVTAKARFIYPFAKLDPRPSPGDPIVKVWVDKELASEAVTYVQGSGREGTVHIEQVLEYNKDPDFLRDRLLYRLTLEARKRVAASPLPGARSSADSARRRRNSTGSWTRRTTASPSTSSCRCYKSSIARSRSSCEPRARELEESRPKRRQ